MSEVLITLGIIGVVAAITIPSLISKFQDMRNIQVLKEDYSILQQVMKRVYDEGADLSFSWNNDTAKMTEWFNTNMQPYMQIARFCPSEHGCWE